MVEFCKKTVESKWFQNLILAFILLAAVGVGLETYQSVVEDYGGLLSVLNWIMLGQIMRNIDPL